MCVFARKPCLLAGVLVVQAACTPIAVYDPPASPRIQIRADGKLVKDGKVFTSLEEATRGNPAAQAEARLAARDGSAGGITGAVGFGTVLLGGLTGALLGATKATQPAALPVLVGAVVAADGLLLASMVLGSNSGQRRLNAINLYNDGLPALPAAATPPTEAAPPGQGPGAGGAR